MSLLYDLLLYGALAVGALLGRQVRAPRVLDLASRATVLALVASLGVLLEDAGGVLQIDVLVPAVLLAVGVVALSGFFVRLLGARPPPAMPTSSDRGRRIARDLTFPGAILVALAVGWELGAAVPGVSPSSGTLLDAFLLVLLFEIGWSIRWDWRDLRGVPRPLAAAGASVVVVGAAYAVLGGVAWRTAFGIVGAFGWYSLAGPLVAQAAGPTFGLIAFLANFLRENLTMTTSPALARAAGGEGIIAAGGATSMDTTLLFAVEWGGERSGGTALAVGTILTLLAPVILGLLLGTL